MNSPFSLHKKGLSVMIRLNPGAREAGYGGLADTVLKFSVTAPPEDGKANRELLRVLSKEWGIPKTAMSLLSGETNRNKVILIEGDGEELLDKMTGWLISRLC